MYWPVNQPYIVGNVEAKLNQTTGYNGAESNIGPLNQVAQLDGPPIEDPLLAIGK